MNAFLFSFATVHPTTATRIVQAGLFAVGTIAVLGCPSPLRSGWATWHQNWCCPSSLPWHIVHQAG